MGAFLLILTLLVAITSSLSAQSDDAKTKALTDGIKVQVKALGELLKATTLHCVLGSGYAADWTSGNPVSKPDSFSESQDPTIFYSIDLETHRAKMMGNAGTGTILVLSTASGLTFIEQTETGNVNTTTVFATYKKGTTEFPCVHSRHLLVLSTHPLPSQYHGACKIP